MLPETFTRTDSGTQPERGTPADGCAFWMREPGADDE
jgi:hypothetical protein